MGKSWCGALLLCCEAFGQAPADPQGRLEHIRTVNLERAASLPSFVADEKAVRYKSGHTDPPQWKYVDTIEAELAVQGGGFARQNTRLDGKPWNKPNFPEFTWSPDFGYGLKALFDPKCNTVIHFEGPAEVSGRTAWEYRFDAAPNGCFGGFSVKNGMFSSTKSDNPARAGRFLVEDPGGSVIQFEVEANEFPKWLGAGPLKQTTSWDYVKIGDSAFLLPVATEIYADFTRGELWHVIVEYKNHRHFEAPTHVTFH